MKNVAKIVIKWAPVVYPIIRKLMKSKKTIK
ncbi:hypothetical protein WAX74_11225 [Psychrobacillus sp. FJAT-51614]|uniref:Stage V sporulation protein M n=1 Tax=Psychrobacillus mangrovi TaxID=3117745 RepID=A0ABU8F5A8_9BACI